jgi:hypothetical protein
VEDIGLEIEFRVDSPIEISLVPQHLIYFIERSIFLEVFH